MMKQLFLLFVFVLNVSYAQDALEASFIKKEDLKADVIVSVDNFGSLFLIQNNELILQKRFGAVTYNNLQLGNIASANAFNPLKISLFYRDLNTLVILDNRLAEIFKVDFNTIASYRNVSHISTGNDNTVWLYNQDTNQLEVYDYLNNKTRVQTLPIADTVLNLKSNYNYCWLLTEKYLYCYNYFGSLISKISNKGYTSISESDGNLVLKKDNELFYLKKNTSEIIKLETPELLINQFLLTNETLYIYDGEFLHQYQIKTN